MVRISKVLTEALTLIYMHFRYLEGLESTFRNQYKDELAKTCIQSHWTTGVIRFAIGVNAKGQNNYVKTEIQDGTLVVTVFSYSNASDCGKDLMDTLVEASGLKLKAALNLKVLSFSLLFEKLFV